LRFKIVLMRLFLAINLPQNIKDALLKEIPRFSYLKFRQIPKENWHITLKFIGEVETGFQSVSTIQEAIQPIAIQFKPFDLRIKDFGFLNRRIFAVNLERSSKLYALFKMIDERLAQAQVVPGEHNRYFNPHITVGRKSPPLPRIGRAGSGFSGQLHSVRHFDLKTREPLSFIVNSVDLMESRLSPHGSLYYLRQVYKLKGV